MNVVPRERILVVDDEAGIRELVGSYLRNEGFEVDEAVSGEEALDRFGQGAHDLVLLDLRLPGMGGLDVLREIRRTSEVYVIVLTARADETDKLIGLELGADDYITKPFSLRELKSRIRALLRRRSLDGGVPEDEYHDDRLIVRRGPMDVELDGQLVRLTVREFELLWYLITTRPRVASRERILERVWGLSSDVETRTVDVHIRALRAKLGSEMVETIIGAGYRFRGFQ